MVTADFHRRIWCNGFAGEFIRLGLAGIPFMLVTGCTFNEVIPTTGSGSIRDVLRTASGYVLEASRQAAATIELGKMGVEKAKETVGDLQHRVNQVQKGMETVKEGKELIKNAVAE